jgi:hypothetical protein
MRSWVIRSVKVVLIFITTVLLLELSYRFYVIDFYEPELMALNDSLTEIRKNRPTVLFLGDSFTANTSSYVAKLRNELPFNLVNSAVSGTGVLETSYMADSRISRFKPNAVVYQIYVGNDLLDIRHRPTGEMSFVRRLYHFISDRLRVLKFINYRLGQFKAYLNKSQEVMGESERVEFSVRNYSSRQKMIFKEEPRFLENTLQLNNGRKVDANTLITKLKMLEDKLDKQTDLILLLIPHCAQVNDTYQERIKLLGSESEVESRVFYETIRNEFPELTIVDVLPNFQMADRAEKRLYLENDPHLSDVGQTELAKIIRPYLEAEMTDR